MAGRIRTLPSTPSCWAPACTAPAHIKTRAPYVKPAELVSRIRRYRGRLKLIAPPPLGEIASNHRQPVETPSGGVSWPSSGVLITHVWVKRSGSASCVPTEQSQPFLRLEDDVENDRDADHDHDGDDEAGGFGESRVGHVLADEGGHRGGHCDDRDLGGDAAHVVVLLCRRRSEFLRSDGQVCAGAGASA
jgi:hypothetical protein